MPRIKMRRAQTRTTAIKKSMRGRLPVKRTINLARAGVETIDPKAATAGIILIILAAAIFSKIFVADRLAAMFRADAEAAKLQSQLDSAYAQIGAYGDLEDEYAHYTYSGMTKEERSLVDRPAVIRMIQTEAESYDDTIEWSLSGNVLTINVSGNDLQQINLMARRLEGYDLVNTCTVVNAIKDDADRISKTAGTSRKISAGSGEQKKLVRASIIAYLENKQGDQK